MFLMAKEKILGIRGPVGSGKSVLCCIKVFMLACDQLANKAGVRESKWLFYRLHEVDLELTALETWLEWFPETQMKRDSPMTGYLTVPHPSGDGTRVDIHLIFMGLETGEDINQTAWTIDEDLQDSDPGKLASIFELEVGKNGPKIKMHNSVQAMAQIAKMQGYEAASKHEIAGPGGGPILTKDVSDLSDEALLALIAGDA